MVGKHTPDIYGERNMGGTSAGTNAVFNVSCLADNGCIVLATTTSRPLLKQSGSRECLCL